MELIRRLASSLPPTDSCPDLDKDLQWPPGPNCGRFHLGATGGAHDPILPWAWTRSMAWPDRRIDHGLHHIAAACVRPGGGPGGRGSGRCAARGTLADAGSEQ